ncbi:hypothetical protein TNCV_711971 [Trichonephila clavipes]|nr:hypothetical protein TNCV_711971 [Trichonephila clavipes]
MLLTDSDEFCLSTRQFLVQNAPVYPRIAQEAKCSAGEKTRSELIIWLPKWVGEAVKVPQRIIFAYRQD